MNSTWLWITIGIIIVVAVVAIALYVNKPVQPAAPTTGQVSGTNTETNVASELNVELPEVNEEVVDVNLPPQI